MARRFTLGDATIVAEGTHIKRIGMGESVKIRPGGRHMAIITGI
jgi:hypothetical protein